MNQYYLGNTLINDSYIGSIRVNDIPQPQNSYTVEYLIVGGGGSGGGVDATVSSTAAGGGAGGLLSGSLLVTPYRTYQVTVGAGGIDGGGTNGNGAFSLFGNLTAFGGGKGGSTTTFTSGQNGGSGGGGGQVGSGTSTAGTGSAGQGNAGAGGTTGRAGAGGGALNAASAEVTGSGLVSSINGTATLYSPGGFTGTTATLNAKPAKPIFSGSGGQGSRASSQGSRVFGGDGANGVVIIRYPGAQRALGGTDGSFTVHTFSNTTGSFEFYSN